MHHRGCTLHFDHRSPARSEEPLPIVLWTTRWIKRRNYLKIQQNKLHSNRQYSENIHTILDYFEKLEKAITDEGIVPEDISLMDKTGFRIGINKDQFIMTKRKRAHLFSMTENREAATAIEAISAGGLIIPTFLILTGQKHTEPWYHIKELHPDTKITMSTTGYTNDEIGLT